MKLVTYRPINRWLQNAFYPQEDFGRDLTKLFGTNLLGSNLFEPDTCWIPPMDVHEHESEYRIRAEVPGVDPKTLDLTVKDDVLTLSGEKHREEEQKNGKVHRIERQYGRFERSFVLPETVDADHIKADFKSGILEVTLPKKEAVKPRRIEVTN